MFNATDVFNDLGLPAESWRLMMPGWGGAMAAMPAEIPVLDPEQLQEALAICSLSPEMQSRIMETAGAIRKCPALKAFFWHACYKMSTVHQSYGSSGPGFAGWVYPEKALGRNARLFYTLVILSIVPEAVRNYRRRMIPEDVIRATLNLQHGLDLSLKQHAEPGSDPAVIYWWRLYAQGRLFTLGRFQYKIAELFSFGAMLRNRNNGRKILPAEPDFKFDSAGFAVQNGMESESDRITVFEETADTFSGYAVHPAGYILPGVRTFLKSEWEAVLRRGDPLLDMHIPGGGGMTPEAAHDSFAFAFRFFREHFAGRYAPAIICRSWIFNTQFEELLPESNLAALMRKCYLFPCVSSGKDGFYFLFGRDYDNPADAPHDTSYRRAMLSVLERGGRLRLGGMLFLEEDLPDYYTNPYRNRFSEQSLK